MSCLLRALSYDYYCVWLVGSCPLGESAILSPTTIHQPPVAITTEINPHVYSQFRVLLVVNTFMNKITKVTSV